MTDITDIKKALETKKIVIGADETMKKIKLGKVSKVFVSHNCPENIKQDLESHSKIAKVDFKVMNKTNEDKLLLSNKNIEAVKNNIP